MHWNNKQLKNKLGKKPILTLMNILQCSYTTAWRKYKYGLFNLSETIVIMNELNIPREEYLSIFIGDNINGKRKRI